MLHWLRNLRSRSSFSSTISTINMVATLSVPYPHSERRRIFPIRSTTFLWRRMRKPGFVQKRTSKVVVAPDTPHSRLLRTQDHSQIPRFLSWRTYENVLFLS
jgi:hypothetical protein